MESVLDMDRLALGIKQPWAELILQGVKTLEIRTRPTRVRGPIYLYTSQKLATETFATDALSRYRLIPGDMTKGCRVRQYCGLPTDNPGRRPECLSSARVACRSLRLGA
ncbi:ASCH domain-containing protein [bacterium]|nr:ASCH domain-containing protein [bacterium]